MMKNTEISKLKEDLLNEVIDSIESIIDLVESGEISEEMAVEWFETKKEQWQS